jgi:hypothetical protein
MANLKAGFSDGLFTGFSTVTVFAKSTTTASLSLPQPEI